MTNLVAQARAEADLLDHDGEPLRATLVRELADEMEYLQKALLSIGEAILVAGDQIRPILEATAEAPAATKERGG